MIDAKELFKSEYISEMMYEYIEWNEDIYLQLNLVKL